MSRLVGTLSRRRAEISDAVLAHVEDPAVAALLIAKTSLAAERGVDLTIADGSDLPRLDPELSTDVSTVLGNLVDNAVDASVSVGGRAVEVGAAPRRRHRAPGRRRHRPGRAARPRGGDLPPRLELEGVDGRRPGCRARARAGRLRASGRRGHGCGRATTVPARSSRPTAGVRSGRGGVRRDERRDEVSVLVVDDDFMVARIHTQFVERTAGFRVVGVASSGQAALDDVARLRPDLVLLDVHLPDMTGHRRAAPAPGRRRRRRRAGGDGRPRGRHRARRGVRGSGALPREALRLRRPARAARVVPRPRTSRCRVRARRASRTSTPSSARPRRRRAAALPKGLSPETAEAVEAALRGAGELSAAECADAVGISRVSARRYLEHFVARGSAVRTTAVRRRRPARAALPQRGR